jgi:PAS domain S-box-containing protein
VTSTSEDHPLFPSRPSLGRSALWIAVIALAYLAAARASLLFTFEPEGIAAIWPPSGIFLAALLLTRRSLRPWLAGVLFAADLVAELLAGTPWVVSLVYALTLTGEAVLSCWLLLRFVGDPFAFKRVRDVIGWLGLSVLLSNALAGLPAAAASLLLSGGHPFLSSWLWWVASDGAGNLVVTPLILGWAAWARLRSTAPRRQRTWEVGALILLATLVSLGLFDQVATHPLFALVLPVVCFPFLLWAAIRLGVPGVATTSAILAVIVVSFAAAGRAPTFSSAPGVLDDLIAVQLFIFALAIPPLFVAAVVAERQAAFDSLGQAEEQHRATFELASIGMAQADPQTGRWFRVNSAMCAITGYTEDEMLRLTVRELTHPDDRERDWDAFLAVVRGDSPSYRIEKRYVRKDGELVWVHVNMTVIRDADSRPVRTMAVIEDVTERKHAEDKLRTGLAELEQSRQVLLSVVEDQRATAAALRLSEEKFAKAFAASPIAMSVTSTRDGRYADVNDVFLLNTGYSKDEIIDRMSDELTIFADPQERARLLDAAMAQGVVYGMECSIRTKRGTLRSCLISTVPVTIGGERYFLSSMLDITERKLAETAERAAKEELQRLLAANEAARRSLLSMLEDHRAAEREIGLLAHAIRAISENVSITDKDSKILFVNEAFLRTYGYTAEELVGQHMRVVRADAYPESTFEEIVKTTAAGGWQGELVNRRKDGSLFPIFLSTSVLRGESGEPLALVGVATDITERKAALQSLATSEERYRRIVNTANEGIWGTDAEYRTTFVNGRLASMLGYLPEEMLGRPVADFLWPEDLTDQANKATRRRSGLAETYERRFRRKDGSTLWALISVVPVADLADTFAGSIAMLADITDLKRTQDSLMTTVAEKETLLREVHHRVKNNLQAMIHLVELQLDNITDGATRVFLHELQEQARTMSLVYEQLYQSDSLARVDMTPYLQTLGSNVLQAFGQGRRIELEVDSAAVTMDVETAMPCGLIVNELLTNALKYAFPPNHPAPPRILVRLAQDGAQYALTVADNGVGLGGVDWQRGSSMGLRLVRMWVTHQLGGTIEASEERGTSWQICIPVALHRKEGHG